MQQDSELEDELHGLLQLPDELELELEQVEEEDEELEDEWFPGLQAVHFLVDI